MSLRRSMIFSLGGAPPLDEVGATSSNTLVAYGFRKLSSTYSGNCLRAINRTPISATCTRNSSTITNIPPNKISLLSVGMYVYIYDSTYVDRSTSTLGVIRTIANIDTNNNTITLSGTISNSGSTSYTGSLYFGYDIPFTNDIFDPTHSYIQQLTNLDTNSSVSCITWYDQSGNNRNLGVRIKGTFNFTISELINDLPIIIDNNTVKYIDGKFSFTSIYRQQNIGTVSVPNLVNVYSGMQVYENNSALNTNFFTNSLNGVTVISKINTEKVSGNDVLHDLFSQTGLYLERIVGTGTKRYNKNTGALEYTTEGTCGGTNQGDSYYSFQLGRYQDITLGSTLSRLTSLNRNARSPYIVNSGSSIPCNSTGNMFLSLRPALYEFSSGTSNTSYNNNKVIVSVVHYNTITNLTPGQVMYRGSDFSLGLGNPTYGPGTTPNYVVGFFNGDQGYTISQAEPPGPFVTGFQNSNSYNPMVGASNQELIIFNNSNSSLITSNRTTIERNMSRYYNVNLV